MLDCGLSVKETVMRLARLGRAPEAVTAIVVTHEHDDHVSGVMAFARRYRTPVWMTPGTRTAATRHIGTGTDQPTIQQFSPHESFEIDDLRLEPFPVPHDAREPAQFVFTNGDVRLGYLTDLGSSTVHVEKALSGCHALVLECNHDREMLKNSSYPPSLKARIAGAHGHLSNDQAAELLGRLDFGWLRHIVAAHLSEQNNCPDLACAALARALDCVPDWVQVADQNAGLPWRDVVRD
ncbi:MAG: MBL fold metallo-hydrolase [Gammaproteobacteria bacterium]|nr:MBL fold metallo-hydrolase [Gammaproteobacteria bacterium]